MTKEPAVARYRMTEAYVAAVRRVRAALQQQGLRIAMELDVAARLRSELGAGVAPCCALYVDDPAVLLEAVVFHRGAALLIPQPVVVTGGGHGSEVMVRRVEAVPESVRDPVVGLARRIRRAVASVGEEEGIAFAGSGVSAEDGGGGGRHPAVAR